MRRTCISGPLCTHTIPTLRPVCGTFQKTGFRLALSECVCVCVCARLPDCLPDLLFIAALLLVVLLVVVVAGLLGFFFVVVFKLYLLLAAAVAAADRLLCF